MELARGRETLTAVVLLVAAVCLRVGVAVRNPIPSGDGVASELEMARHLDEGLGFTTMRKWMLSDPSMEPLRPEGNRQPAMSVLIAPVFMLTGASFGAAQAVALATGILALAALWMWSRRLFGPVPALAVLAWFTLDPAFLWYSTQPDSLMLFTALFFALLSSAAEPGGVRRACLLGLLTGLAWLARTQAVFLAFSMAVWILARFRRRLASLLAFGAVFLAVASPWLVRNVREFGSPFYIQSSQVLLTENHYSVWEVRDTPPSPGDLSRNQGPGAVARYVAAGALRVVEPFATGNLHRGEVFAWPPMILFAVFSVLALADGRTRRAMLLPGLACLPMTAALVLHEHSGRYLTFLAGVVVALGFAGLFAALDRQGARPLLRAGVLAVAALPLVRPFASVMMHDDRARAREARAASDWIAVHSGPEDWVVTFPSVEMFVWDYRRPTLTMPNDYEQLLWPCLEEHGVRYVVVDPDLPRLRPWLSSRWRMAPDGSGWEVEDPPPFLREAWRSPSGLTIVYEWEGEVPEGFMAVDSLPRDNLRALPPS